MRRRGAPASARGRPLSSRSKSRTLRRPPATSSIVPTSTRFMWRMNVSASISNRSTSPSRRQPGRDTSRSKRWWYVSVGVKAVKSCVPGERGARTPRAPRGRPGAATTARGGARTATATAARARGRRSCAPAASWRAEKPSGTGLGGQDRDLVGQQRVDRPQRRRRTRVRDDLPERVHAAVGPAGDRQVDRPAQHGGQRPLELGRRPSAGRAAPPSPRTGCRRTRGELRNQALTRACELG